MRKKSWRFWTRKIRPAAIAYDAIRNLKTVQLEVRPVYHKTDDRIRSHVFSSSGERIAVE